MTVQLKQLLVTADMNVAGYVRGAQQKKAADDAMVASSREAASAIQSVGAQATVTETSLSRASDGVERLKRQFVTGYAAAADFERNLKIVGSGLDRGKLTTEQAAVAIENLSRRYGQAIDPQSRLAQGNHNLAAASRMAMESLTSQSSAVEDLTASYSRMAAEARAAQAAEANRSRFDQFLGVGISPVGAAASSASVFEAEFSRIAQLEQIAKMRSAQSSSYFASDLNTRLGIGGFGTDARASAAVFEEAAREAERYAQKAALLRAQLDPVRALQERVNAELAEYAVLAQRGEISATELARAQAMARGRLAEPASGVGGRNFAATNAMFQFQDIAMTAAMGMNPAMIGLQQGSQLAGAYAGMSGREALSTSLAGLAGMVNPVSLIAIGLTTAAAAAIQFGSGLLSSSKEAENFDNILKRHQQTLKDLAEQWGGVIEKQSQYGQRSSAVISLGVEMSGAQMRDALRRQIPDILQSITSAAAANRQAIGADPRAFRNEPMFGLLTEKVGLLTEHANSASPDISKLAIDIFDLQREISELALVSQNNGIRKLADDIVAATKPVEEYARAAQKANQEADRFFNSVGPLSTNPMLLSQGLISRKDMAAYEELQRETRRALNLSQQAFDAEMYGLSARSPQERAEAARRLEGARFDMNETAAVRRQRIEQAGALALAQAERQLLDARRDRARALDASMAQQQVELSLIGRTISEQERLRMEHRLIAELRAEAARNNTSVDEEEISRIRAKSSEYGRLAEQMAAQRALLGQDREIAAINQRLSLVGQSEAAQVRTNALMQAEMRLREMGINLGSREAEQYLRKAEYIALQTDELRKQEAALGRVRDTAEGSIDTLLDRFIEGDPLGGLADVAKEWSKTILQLGVANPLKNGLLGTNHETLNDIGGLNGLFSKVFGGGMSTASMSVTATAVSVNGGMPGIGNPFGPANDNFSPTTTLGDLLGAGGASKGSAGLGGSGASLAWNFWKSKGLADHQVAGILGNIKAESAFNPLAVGDGGNAFGLYQHNDRRFRLFDAIGGKGNLSDALAQHRFAYSELMGPESRAWAALKNSTDVRSATAAFAGFERPSGFSWANPEGAHNFVGRLNGANEALAKFGGTAGSATNMLGTFGTGLDKFGNALSSINLGGGAGGGGFNWGSLFSGFTPNTTLGSFLINGFADGTEWTRGGLAMVGERGREIVRLPRGSQVVSNHRTESLAAAGRNEVSQGGGFSQVINNYSGEPVKTEERPDGRGGRRQIVTIGSVVAEAMGTPGSPLARQMEQQFGVKRRMNNKWQ
ncbi:phage tail tip lysozyme [Shinella yambaruensis]|uniref:phage tail tip lysozyme n=1 Tax=Shinella yambaruensis TaxID=415996 RepID=UPI003D794AE8